MFEAEPTNRCCGAIGINFFGAKRNRMCRLKYPIDFYDQVD